MSSEPDVCIGVLALQGSFREHVASFDKLPGISAVEVRNKKQLEGVDGLVIPGGELLLCLLRTIGYGRATKHFCNCAWPLLIIQLRRC